ncbi:MAG: MarR family EPS-associated transcriptional regulator [Chitinivibrionales bacterium]|nr:MarR family EPS-associated transcriptional regulator [Chitinivibrionales bacterium]
MIEFKVLREIEQNPAHTQRSLASTLDISLGKVNYVVAGLVEKGIIKARRLTTVPGTIRWRYILTPEGMKEKISLTKTYLGNRIHEFENMRREIEELKAEVDK